MTCLLCNSVIQELFVDDQVANTLESLAGTLKAAKKKAVVSYGPELLLQVWSIKRVKNEGFPIVEEDIKKQMGLRYRSQTDRFMRLFCGVKSLRTGWSEESFQFISDLRLTLTPPEIHITLFHFRE